MEPELLAIQNVRSAKPRRAGRRCSPWSGPALGAWSGGGWQCHEFRAGGKGVPAPWSRFSSVKMAKRLLSMEVRSAKTPMGRVRGVRWRGWCAPPCASQGLCRFEGKAGEEFVEVGPEAGDGLGVAPVPAV